MSDRNMKTKSDAYHTIMKEIYASFGISLFFIGFLGLNADLLIPSSILISGYLISDSIDKRNNSK